MKAFKNGISEGEFLEQYVLPDIGNIKSGDFGEMLSYFFITEHYTDKGFVLFCPRKWLWKEDRNKSTPYTDVVGFYREDKTNPSENDFIVSVESKMKATKSDKHRIQDAIDGANKDKLTRLAKTLVWLKEKYARNGDEKNRIFIERYVDPVGIGTYNKIYKAFAILERIFENAEITQLIKDKDGITIIVITMKNLKDIYEKNLRRIIESV
jgi:hypothetical protein